MRHSIRAAVMTSTVLAIVLAIAGATAMLALAPAARAETAYRYWTYWSVTDGAWRFATLGPASAVPVDGSVEGWRFAITSAAGSAGDAPETNPATAFDSICGGTPAQAGMKRVALTIDFGMPQDAPEGELSPVNINTCVVGELDATGYELLRSITEVRVGDGLICGIAGYPLAECAELVEDRAPASTGMSTEGASPSILPEPGYLVAAPESAPSAGPLITGVAVLVAAVIGLLAWRGRGRP